MPSYSDTAKTVGYLLGTLPFIWICVAWNLAGLVLCMAIGTPVLFFDMTGTAIASLSRGLGYGVVVALASNLAGAIFLPDLPGFDHGTYLWFGFTNAVGAVVWATAPRIIVHYQNSASKDFLSTDPGVGYRTLLYQILGVGALAGLTVGLAGLLTQYLALGCSANDMTPCTSANPAVRSGDLIATYISSLFRIETWDWMLPSLALLLFGVLDKIVATASAMMIIFMFHEVPNYNEQSRKLNAYRESERSHPTAFRIARVAYALSLLVLLILYGRLLFGGGRDYRTEGLILFLLAAAGLASFLLRWGGMPLYNVFHRSNREARCFYHDKARIAEQSVHRDVYEDIMKTVVILITLSGLVIDRIQARLLEENLLAANAVVFPLVAGDGALVGQRLLTLAAPIVFLNLWRYFVVFLARFSGTLYRGAKPLAIAPGWRPLVRTSMKIAGVLLLILFAVRAWQ